MGFEEFIRVVALTPGLLAELEAYEKMVKAIRNAGCTLQGGLDRLCENCQALVNLEADLKAIESEDDEQNEGDLNVTSFVGGG